MEKKVVLLVLIVIAILAVLFLGAGLLRRDPELEPKSYKPSTLLAKMDRFFEKRRPPFRVARMNGCNRSGNVFTFSGDCGVAIDTGKARSSTFKLTGVVAAVEICFALSPDKLTECMTTGKGRGSPEEEPVKFTVTSDSAFLHLYCRNPGGGCRVTVQ